MGNGGIPVVFCIAGLGFKSREQHSPLLLGRYADVTYLDPLLPSRASARGCIGSVFSAFIDDIVGRAELNHANGHPVVLVGSSFGGNIAAFVAAKLVARHPDAASWLSVLYSDSPFGFRTFKPDWVPPWLILSPIGDLALSLFSSSVVTMNSYTGLGLPKSSEITRPNDKVISDLMCTADRTVSDAEWIKWVKETSKPGLRGQKSRLMRLQIQWMTYVVESGQLEQALRAASVCRSLYIECVGDANVNVMQPRASQKFQYCAGMDVKSVEGPHCGYRQMQQQFSDIIGPFVQAT